MTLSTNLRSHLKIKFMISIKYYINISLIVRSIPSASLPPPWPGLGLPILSAPRLTCLPIHASPTRCPGVDLPLYPWTETFWGFTEQACTALLGPCQLLILMSIKNCYWKFPSWGGNAKHFMNCFINITKAPSQKSKP